MNTARAIFSALGVLALLGAPEAMADDGTNGAPSTLIVPYFAPSFTVRPMENPAPVPVTPATPPDVTPATPPLLSFRPPSAMIPSRSAGTAPVQVLPTMTPATNVPVATAPVPAPAPSPAPAAAAAAAKAPASSPAPAAPPSSDTAFYQQPASPGTPNYAIHAGDSLQVSVAGETDFDGRVLVQNSGAITLPYVGDIKVEGLTIPQATAALTKRLSEYYVNPVVSVDVTQYRKKEFVILGQVNSPGVYTFSLDQESMSLVEAIAKAGGVKQYGDLGHVTIKRVAGGKEQVLTVNAREAKAISRNEEGLNFQVLPGDTIVIALFRSEINLLGEVRRPGIYTLPPLLDSIDLIEAIAMAGGTSDGKDMGVVHVKREVDGKVTTLNVDAKDIGRNKADASFPIYAGDTVIVETLANEYIVLGQVNRPGSYHIPALHDSVDLIEAIAMAGGATRLADTSHVTIRRTVNGKVQVIKVDAQKLARSTDQVDVLPGDRIVISERMF